MFTLNLLLQVVLHPGLLDTSELLRPEQILKDKVRKRELGYDCIIDTLEEIQQTYTSLC